MGEYLGKKISDILRQKSERRKWVRAIVSLSLAVLLVTNSLLALRGVAMSQDEHTHTDACYEETTTLVCGQEESDGHQHTDECYTRVRGELVCQDTSEDHVHTDDCYEWHDELTCATEEGEGAHHHTEDCYHTERTLVCGMVETRTAKGEEPGKDAEAAAVENGETAAEETGVEGESIDAEQTSVVDPAVVVEMPAQRFEAETEDHDLKVVVEADAGTFPIGTTMEIEEIAQDDEEVTKAVTDTMEKDNRLENEEVVAMKAVDIKFLNAEGVEIEPLLPVRVTMTSETIKQSENVVIVHLDDEDEEKNEIIKQKEEEELKQLEIEPAEDQVVFEAEKFSKYVIVGTETITVDYISDSGKIYEVTVSYDNNADIPKGAKLEITEYGENDSEYIAAKEEVLEYLLRLSGFSKEEFDVSSIGIDALDIKIVDTDGNPIEPKAPVKVKIVRKGLPEDIAIDDLRWTMAVQHHVKNEDGSITVEGVADTGDMSEGKVSVSDNGVEAAFSVDSFSTYTVTWGNNNRAILHFVDEEGHELTGVRYNSTTIDGGTIALNTLITGQNQTLDLSAFTVNGKTLSNTHINTYNDLNGAGNNRTIVANELRRNNGTFQYRSFKEGSDKAGTQWNNVANNTEFYLVYSDTGGGGGGGGGGDDPEAPDFGEIGNKKEISDNENGTYQLSLSVTGQAQALMDSTHVNVVIVLDTSNSMDTNGRTRLADAKRALVGTTAQEQENSIIHRLLANNTEDDPEAVEIAFITFNNNATSQQGFTTNEDTLRRIVNQQTTARGTNWADALDTAMKEAGDSDPTYVVFITDGAPSQYWKTDLTGIYVDGEGCMLGARDEARALVRGGYELFGVFGWGEQSDYDRHLLDGLINYAYNNETASVDHYFQAADTPAMIAALESILDRINMNFAFANVKINDGLTGLTSTEVSMASVEAESFNYTITYVDATDAAGSPPHTVSCVKNDDGTITIPSVTYNVRDPDPDSTTGYKTKTTEAVTVTGADYENGRITWSLNRVGSTEPYMLEEAWTYKVDFTVWPSQHSYDLVAALNNDPTIWGHSYTFVDTGETIAPETYMPQINGGPSGPFALKTNTDASVDYQEVTAKTVDGVTTYTYGPVKTAIIQYDDDMDLVTEQMAIQKFWENPLDSRPVEGQIDLSVTLDENDFLNHVILTTPDFKKENVHIACGLITQDPQTGEYEVRETGHDFTFSEVHDDNALYWNLEADIFRPMVINGVLTMLIKVESEEEADYTIVGNYYKVIPGGDHATISATNVRRSRLNLRKFVTDETDGTVDPDANFKYTVKIDEASGEDVYFSVFGTGGAQYLTPEQGVIVSSNVTPKMMEDDDGNMHQYYVAPDNETFTVNAKAGWSLMFLNLSNGTTYTITESEMPAGFEFDKEEPDAQEYYYATPGDPSSRTTRPVPHNMSFEGTTTTGEITQSNTQYRVDYHNIWKGKDVTLIKVKEDGETEIGGAIFDISQKNGEGVFVTIDTFTSSTEDQELGEVFNLGYGTYCLTETKSPSGYIILKNKVYFKVTTEGIVLCDENEEPATYENATVSGTDKLTITIKNTPGETLPAAGGPGTFLYTLSGLAIVLSSALMYGFRMRRRERRLN